MIHLDSSFLIDLQREVERGKLGPARASLARLRQDRLAISMFVLCELAAGAELATQPETEQARVETVTAPFEVVYPDERFPRLYGRLSADLERRGQRIGAMDLLIATAALLAGASLVTRNRREFSRIPDLRLLSY